MGGEDVKTPLLRALPYIVIYIINRNMESPECSLVLLLRDKAPITMFIAQKRNHQKWWWATWTLIYFQGVTRCSMFVHQYKDRRTLLKRSRLHTTTNCSSN